MGFSIDNYSVLNNYNYVGKSPIISKLDFLSTPCRRWLGGRNVDVIAQTHENKMSTTMKVITVFFSVLIFPIAVISIASLILKLGTFPFIWEKKIVKKQTQESLDLINQFKSAYNQGQYDTAIQIVKQRPDMATRSEINSKLFKIINQKINNGAPWNELESLIQFLPSSEAIDLINHAVKLKCQFAHGSEVVSFVNQSLRDTSFETIEACYKKMLSSSLHVDLNEDLILTASKMDLADHLIRKLTQLSIQKSDNQLGPLIAQNNAMLMRHSIFKKGQNTSHYFFIFSSDEEMQQLSTAMRDIRNVNRIGAQAVHEFKFLSASNPIQWDPIVASLARFQNNLKSVNLSIKEGEVEYIHAVEEILRAMTQFAGRFQSNPSVEEIEKCYQEFNQRLQEQKNKVTGYFENSKISSFQLSFENIIAVLRLKRNKDLIDFPEQIKSILLNNIVQYAILMQK